MSCDHLRGLKPTFLRQVKGLEIQRLLLRFEFFVGVACSSDGCPGPSPWDVALREAGSCDAI